MAERNGAFVRAPKYEWTDDMDEISGFGGGYEQDCRDMLAAALAWLDARPLFAPRYHSYENVVGILEEDDLSAEELSEVTAAAAKRGGATVAMHQVVISHALWIRENGWEAYQKLKREAKARDASAGLTP